MNFPLTTYKEHFTHYSGSMTTRKVSSRKGLTHEEEFLLNAGGLPKKGLPYFYFDTSIHEWRSLPMTDCLLCLGTCEGPRTRHYIYLARDHQVYIQWSSGQIEFVNSSLFCLMQSILSYSLWLEDIENIVEHSGSYKIQNEDIFELYYSIRSIDPMAVVPEGLWQYLMREYPVFEMEEPHLDESLG